MVVGTPDVDDVVDALELIPVIGNVGGEVGVLAVGLDQDAVLVIAQVGGAEPQGAVLGVEVAILSSFSKARSTAEVPAVSPSVSFTYSERSEYQRSKSQLTAWQRVAHVVDHLHIAALAELSMRS